MDLGSSLEEEQHSLNFQQEEHELPNTKRKTNVPGTAVNTVFAVLHFLVMCGGLSTMTVFILISNEVNKGISTYQCILFASYSPPLEFGEVGVCRYVTWSMASIGIVGALYICGFCGRALCSLCLGLPTFNLLAVIDVIIYVFLTLVSISVAVIVRLGRQHTCAAVRAGYINTTDIPDCPDIFNLSSNNEVAYSQKLYVTEMMAWATSLLLLLLTLGHLLLLIGFFRRCSRSFRGGNRAKREDEMPGSFVQAATVDDDEPLLNPAGDADAWSSTVDRNDHTSFPPYNLGFSGDQSGYRPPDENPDFSHRW